MHQSLTITSGLSFKTSIKEQFTEKTKTTKLILNGYVPQFKDTKDWKTTQKLIRNYAVLEIATLVESCQLSNRKWLAYFQGLGLIMYKPLLETGLHLVKLWTLQNANQSFQLLAYLIQQTPNQRGEFVPYYLALQLHFSRENFEVRYEIVKELLSEPLVCECSEAFVAVVIEMMRELLQYGLGDEIHGFREMLQDQQLISIEEPIYELLHDSEMVFGLSLVELCLIKKLDLTAPPTVLHFLIDLMQKNNHSQECQMNLFVSSFISLSRMQEKDSFLLCVEGLQELLKDGSVVAENHDQELSRLIAEILAATIERGMFSEAEQIQNIAKVECFEEVDFEIKIRVLENFILNENFEEACPKLRLLLAQPIPMEQSIILVNLAEKVGISRSNKAFKALFSLPTISANEDPCTKSEPAFQSVVQNYIRRLPPNSNNLPKLLILLGISTDKHIPVWGKIIDFLLPQPSNKKRQSPSPYLQKTFEILARRQEVDFLFLKKNHGEFVIKLAVQFGNTSFLAQLLKCYSVHVIKNPTAKNSLFPLEGILEQVFKLFRSSKFIGDSSLLEALSHLVLHLKTTQFSSSFIELFLASQTGSHYPECLAHLDALLTVKMKSKELHQLHTKLFTNLSNPKFPLDTSRLPLLIAAFTHYANKLEVTWQGLPRINYMLLALAIIRITKATKNVHAPNPSFLQKSVEYLRIELKRCIPSHIPTEEAMIDMLKELIKFKEKILFQACMKNINISKFISTETYDTLIHDYFIQDFREAITESPFACDLDSTVKALINVSKFLKSTKAPHYVKTTNLKKLWEKILTSAFIFSALTQVDAQRQKFTSTFLKMKYGLTKTEKRSLISLSNRKGLTLLINSSWKRRKKMYNQQVENISELINEMEKLSHQNLIKALPHFREAYEHFRLSISETDLRLHDLHQKQMNRYKEKVDKWLNES